MKYDPKEYLFASPPKELEPFLSFFKSRFKDSLLAVIFYGSKLHSETASPTSSPDFYVIVSSYKDAHKSLFHRLLNKILPPSIYFLTINERFCKYNILSIKDFRRELSEKARDIYNLGRLSKRFLVIYWKNESIKEEIAGKYLEGLKTVCNMAAATFNTGEEIALDGFIKRALSLSYIGETRVEADDKVDKLFMCERDFYTHVFNNLLSVEAEKFGCIYSPEDKKLKCVAGGLNKKLKRLYVRFFLSKSKFRTVLRWPKYAFTCEGWVDYLAAKVERTKGIKLKLTEKERRHPFIFGWKYLFLMWRKGYLK